MGTPGRLVCFGAIGVAIFWQSVRAAVDESAPGLAGGSPVTRVAMQTTPTPAIRSQSGPNPLRPNELPNPAAVIVHVRGYEIQTGKMRLVGLSVPLATVPVPSEKPAEPKTPLAEGQLTPRAAGGRILAPQALSDSLRQIDARSKAGYVKTLANVAIRVVPGQPARLRSGSEFPVPVPQADGSLRNDVRFIGLEVEINSRLRGDRVRLDCRITHSEKDTTRTVKAGDVIIPGLRSSRLSVAADLAFGETCLIGQITPPMVMEAAIAKVAGVLPDDARSLEPVPATPPDSPPLPAHVEVPAEDPIDILWLVTAER